MKNDSMDKSRINTFINDMFYFKESIKEAERIIEDYDARNVLKNKIEKNFVFNVDRNLFLLSQKIMELKDFIYEYFIPRIPQEIIDQSFSVIDRAERILKCEYDELESSTKEETETPHN